jgi:hypothetical protein
MSYHSYGSGGSGSPYFIDPVSTASALPSSGIQTGTLCLVLDTDILYEYNGASWQAIHSGPISTGNLTESTSSVLTINNGTNAVVGSGTSIQVKQASVAQDGFLSSADWSTFNSKEPAQTKGSISETTSSVLTISNGSNATVGPNTTIQVKQSATAQDGYLSSTDWNTFNNKANAVIPSTNQRVHVNYLSGSDSTGNGSYEKPFKSVQVALASITDATINKPYTIFLGANRQIETGDVFLKPYTFIVGDVQRSTYFRINSGSLKPSTDHATTSSWTGLANLYFGGSSVLNWDLQALGGNNCTFLIQNCTMSGPVTFKGRNAGGGDFLETYVGLELTSLTMDSTYFQIQSIEIGGAVSITNTQGVSGLSGTFRNVCFDDNVTIDATGGAITAYMEQNNFCGAANTLTTIGTVAVEADARALPPTSRQTLSVGTTLTIKDDISNDKYTPTTPANWDTAPSKLQAAVDAVALASNTASATKTGVLSSTDWSTFNGKQAALTPGSISETTSSILTISNGTSSTVGPNTTIEVKQSSSSQSGYLSSTDWSTFNGKQAALGFTPEDVSNKSTNTSLGTSDTLYPSQNAVKTYVDTNSGGISIESKTSAFTAANRKTYLVSTSGGAVAVQLPSPALNTIITIKDSGFTCNSNNITLVRAGSEKIENVAATYTLDSNGGSWTIVSDGTDWFLV